MKIVSMVLLAVLVFNPFFSSRDFLCQQDQHLFRRVSSVPDFSNYNVEDVFIELISDMPEGSETAKACNIILDLLDSRSDLVRIEGMMLAANLPQEIRDLVMPVILEDLMDIAIYSDTKTRASAIGALGNLGIKNERVMNVLINFTRLGYQDLSTISAISALGNLGVTDGIGLSRLIEIAEVRNHEHYSEYHEALEALCKLCDLGLRNERVTSALARSLGFFGVDHQETKKIIVETLSKLMVEVTDEAIIDKLVDIAGSGVESSTDAAIILGNVEIPTDRMIELVDKLISSADRIMHSGVRGRLSVILDKLGYLGIADSRIVEMAMEIIDNVDSSNVADAINVLGNIGVTDEEAVSRLQELTSHTNDYIRVSAIEALVKLDKANERMRDTLIEIAKKNSISGSTDFYIGEKAIATLSNPNIVDEKTIECLVEVMGVYGEGRGSGVYSGYALDSLASLGVTEEIVIEALIEAFTKEYRYESRDTLNFRIKVAKVLGNLGIADERVIRKLARLIKVVEFDHNRRELTVVLGKLMRVANP
ncbi:MAG: HEAT repeat domain-containing protein [Candidatus Saelkia tenebricola]|nr:HEAT repeat domain-containing protein [Candidatus Saelkia tenebricola]